MSEISNIVSVIIDRQTKFPSQAGFGTFAFISTFLPFEVVNPLRGDTFRYQLYNSLDEVSADGWGSETTVYAAAKAFYSQSPNPGTFMLGRKGLGESWDEALAAINVEYSDWYAFVCDFEDVVTESAVNDDVVPACAWAEANKKLHFIASADKGLLGINIPATQLLYSTPLLKTPLSAWNAVDDGAFKVRGRSSSSPGDVFEFDVTGLDFSDTGVFDDIPSVLDEIGAQYDTAAASAGAGALTEYDYYSGSEDDGFVLTFKVAGAGGAATQLEIVAPDSGTDLSGAAFLNTSAATTLGGWPATSLALGIDDLGTTLKALNYDRTILFYHSRAIGSRWTDFMDYEGNLYLWRNEFIQVAAIAEAFPYVPASQTFAYKNFAGVVADEISGGGRSYALANNVNIYITVADVPITKDGTVVSGEYIDVMRGVDWLTARLEEAVFTLLIQNRKVPYTDTGVALIENTIRGVMQRASEFLLDGESITYDIPRVADVPAASRGSRTLPDIGFSARLQGAIHKVEIRGTVTV